MLTPGHPHHVGSDQQHKTAAAFFAKKKKCGNLPQSPGHLPYSPRKEPPSPHDGYTTSYASVLGQCPPVTPSGLLKKILEPREAQGLGKGPRDTQGLGKVRVYLKVHDHQESDQEQVQFKQSVFNVFIFVSYIALIVYEEIPLFCVGGGALYFFNNIHWSLCRVQSRFIVVGLSSIYENSFFS